MPITSNRMSMPPREKAMIFVVLAILLAGIAYTTYGPPRRNNALRQATDSSLIYGKLPADPIQANAAFRARVLATFPLLTPADNLIQALTRQGFISDGWFTKRMTFRPHLGDQRACDFTASVTWETDDRARLRAIDARFLRTLICDPGSF